jgi:Na+/H+-dicarboxylate symporter
MNDKKDDAAASLGTDVAIGDVSPVSVVDFGGQLFPNELKMLIVPLIAPSIAPGANAGPRWAGLSR